MKHFSPRILLLVLITCCSFITTYAQSDSEIVTKYIDSLRLLDQKIIYQKGLVTINEGIELTIPTDYKFVPKESARMIVENLWDNPEDSTVLGMIVKEDFSLTNFGSWAFIVSYDEGGYVKDEDAQKIDYNELLKAIQEDEIEHNKQRNAMGYESMHLLDWAVTPYYDHDRKILHWAKKLKFGNEDIEPEELTLNYDVRILGRKGVLSLNAVGIMEQLQDINAHIADVLSIANFKNGYAYRDFDPSIDDVAVYTIGGLVAGKVLAKTGILVLLAKNIKLIIFGLIALIGAFRKKIAGWFGKNKNDEQENNTAFSSEVVINDTEVKTHSEEQFNNQNDYNKPTNH